MGAFSQENVNEFLFGKGGSSDKLIDDYQREALGVLDKAKSDILAQYPQMATQIGAEYDSLVSLIGQKGETMKVDLQKQINVGQIKTREDLSRFMGGAPTGRVGGMMAKQSMGEQQKLSDLMGGVRQEQAGMGLQRAQALTGLEREKQQTLAGLIGKEADIRTKGAEMKAQAAEQERARGGAGLLGAFLPQLAGLGGFSLLSELFPKSTKRLYGGN